MMTRPTDRSIIIIIIIRRPGREEGLRVGGVVAQHRDEHGGGQGANANEVHGREEGIALAQLQSRELSIDLHQRDKII